MPDPRVIVGDCIEVMRGMEAGSVQCCMTSPPYWGLRDYGTAEWEGGDSECDHRPPDDAGVTTKPSAGQREHAGRFAGSQCRKCGARRIDQQIGLEPTPEAYIAKMVEVFREVRRVLRDDGVLYLNMGDSYANDGKWGGATGGKHCAALHGATGIGRTKTCTGLKSKDLCMMPSRLALALQADGWWVRSRLPWLKRSAMPESGASDGANVTFKLDGDSNRVPCGCGSGCLKCHDGYRLKGCAADRPTSAIEYVFLLTKSARYFWDAEAARKQVSGGAHSKGVKLQPPIDDAGIGHKEWHKYTPDIVASRNFRNSDLFYESLKAPHGLICIGDEPVALDVNPEPFKGCHFATFPRRLVTPLIKAATSEKGCCPECGAPWKRIIEQTRLKRERPNDRTARHEAGDGVNACGNTVAGVAVKTLGWQPGCGCLSDDVVLLSGEPDDGIPVPFDPVPCTVIDPFLGSGTTLLVVKLLGLNGIGIELNESYAKMARRRIANPESEPKVEDVEGQRMLFEEG